jgi:hypothetical protein
MPFVSVHPMTFEEALAKEPLLRWLKTGHLGPELQPIVECYQQVGIEIICRLPPSAERTIALRDLFSSKDNAVRAMVDLRDAAAKQRSIERQDLSTFVLCKPGKEVRDAMFWTGDAWCDDVAIAKEFINADDASAYLSEKTRNHGWPLTVVMSKRAVIEG